MKKFLTIITFTLAFNAQAENSRSPAVLDGSCNLNIALSYRVMENGKEIVKEKEITDVQKEQCREVQKCLNSASEEDYARLKNLEVAACSNTLKAVIIKTPGPVIDKSFDGQRTVIQKIEPAIVPSQKPTTTPR